MVFRRDGLSEVAATFFLTAIRTRANQRPLETAEHYREAWVAAQAAMYVLTSDDDGSEAATWVHAISHAIFDYEDAYEKQHGYRPLHPGGADWLTVRSEMLEASASARTLILSGGAWPPYFGAHIGAKLQLMPRITDFLLLLGVGLILLSCSKKIDGNTSFGEATKGFQKELTKDQRKSAIEQLQTETAGKP